MKRKSITLVSSVVVLGILCAGYYGIRTYVSKQEQAQEESEEEETTYVLSVNSDDITSLQFVIDKKEVTFTKDGDEWIKADEEAFPVDQDVLTDAAASISSVIAERTLSDVVSLNEYELDSPANTITVSTEDGEETVLRIGMENESVSQYYVEKDEDKNTVYLVDAATIDPFMNSLYDYAQTGTFPDVSSEDIKKIEIQEQDASYDIEEDPDSGFWYVSDGTDSEKADSAKAQSLTSAVSTLEYDSFVNYNCTDLSEYGLDNPYGTITVSYDEEVEVEIEEDGSEDEEDTVDTEETTDTADAADAEETTDTEDIADTEEAADTEDAADAEEAADIEDTADTENIEDTEDTEETETEIVSRVLTIYVGDEAENDTRYVKVNDSNEIYTIAQENLDTILGKNVSELWDLTVNYLSVNDLDHLDIVYNDESYQIDVSRETTEDEDGEEQVTLSYRLNGNDLDSDTFTTFYNKVVNMAGQRRLTEEFDPSTEPELQILFTDVDENEISTDYYEYDSNFYAISVDGDKVYLVNKMTVKDLIEALEVVLGD